MGLPTGLLDALAIRATRRAAQQSEPGCALRAVRIAMHADLHHRLSDRETAQRSEPLSSPQRARDSSQPWPVGLEMLCYMLSREAHHRGQVCMLAHQLGFPLPNEVAHGIWNWEKL